MKITIRLFILAFVVGFVLQPCTAGVVIGTVGQTCYKTTSGSNSYSISVFGDWIENIDRVTTNASGVTVTIISKLAGYYQRNEQGIFKEKGKVTLNIKTNNATPGNKTISLINDPEPVIGGGETFTFTITVVGAPTVTSADVPTPEGPFREITVTLHGTGLQEARDPIAEIVTINQIPYIDIGDSPGLSGVNVQVLSSSSSTSLQAKISFTRMIQDATVRLTLSSDNDCAPLGNDITPARLSKSVRVKASNIRNYVESITFPGGSVFTQSTTGKINLNLLFAAPTSTGIKLKSGIIIPQLSVVGSAGNSKVFFKFDPPDAFAQLDGTPFPTISGSFIVGKANPGEYIIPIMFKVIRCPLGLGFGGRVTEVKIQTWVHNTNSNLLPNFVEKTFSVRCQ